MISVGNLTSDVSLTDGSSYATASISPSANHLLLAVVASFRNGAGTVAPTVTGLGLTWTQIVTTVTGDDKLRITIFRAFSPTTPTPGALTFDFGGQTQDRCLWSICNASDAVSPQAQSGSKSINGGTCPVTLAAFADPVNNAAFGGFSFLTGLGAHSYNVGSGFTQIAQGATSEAGLQINLLTEWKLGQDTEVDATISGGVTGQQVGVAIEIPKAPDPPIPALLVVPDVRYGGP